jgi:hypothetical protein
VKKVIGAESMTANSASKHHQELKMVSDAHGRANPDAVVIEADNASIRLRAVFGAERASDAACCA